MPGIKTADDLLYHYTDPKILPFVANGIRHNNAFARHPDLGGRCLELGFNSGLTVWRLAKKYPDLVVDGIDFNPAIERLIPFIKGFLPNVGDLWLCDSSKIDRPDGHYDCITSLDYFEHLPLFIYVDTLLECARLLKPGGLIWVYFGRPEAVEHINRREDRSVIEDFWGLGFKLIEHGDVLVFQKGKG